jgi:heme exporter protein C
MSTAQLLSSSTRTHSIGQNRFLKAMSLVAVLGFIVGLYMALAYAETDSMQGDVQRLFYIHLGALMGAALSYSIAFISAVVYLRTQNVRWDTLALSGVEVGLVLTIIALATGSIWARPTWNTWWTWDPRATAAAVMALTYGAYLMLRNGIENAKHRRIFASVYAMLAISTVIYTFVVTRLRSDSIHPIVIGSSATNAQSSFAMTVNMELTLGINVAVWCCLIVPVLIAWRIRLENTRRRASDT